MSKTWLVIGIIITGLSLLAITVFSLSNFILKRIYKDEEKLKTKEQKQKDKTVKRVLKTTKRFLKIVNKKLVEHYLAFYGIAVASLSVGTVLTTVSGVQVAKEARQSETSIVVSSEELSSEASSHSETSTEPTSTTSEPASSTEPEQSSTEQTSEESSGDSALEPTKFTVNFYVDNDIFYTTKAYENMTVKQPQNDPYKEESIFQYWSDAPGGGAQYDFSTAVTGDLNLYAYFLQECTINYYYINDLSEPLLTVKVAYDDHLEDPHIKSPTNNKPLKWYYDQTLESEVDFNNDKATSSLINLFGTDDIN